MKRYVCVHGHFYQPPRENPWLEAIERQPSAAPYHDWNERVAAECYVPNAAARVLDERGRILRIVNNYERLSFDIGPTLAAWLEEEAPDVYEAILSADALSAGRHAGHGTAIAQAYGHAIMPLASERDRRTHVAWGVRDFERRFGRAPEGMWLPETAADLPTLEELVAAGIRFTVLAPHQAARWRPLGGGEDAWLSGPDGPDPRRAYLQRLPSGREIVLFFYDGALSRGVAFQGLLGDGARLVTALLDAFDPAVGGAQLVHLATDGETFGHHHRHGEMALAFALERLAAREDVEVVTYGRYLELHPPEHEVELEERTSWSCTHGVERWRSDCGCQAGGEPGWHQAWRAPLREALDALRAAVDPAWEAAAGELFDDPWAARDAYIDVVLDRGEASVEAFLSAHGRAGRPPADRVRALQLMELQRHALLVYTSCGWFFNDLAGIETVQVLRYAARAVELGERLLGEPLEPGFVERLTAALGNRPELGDGRAVWERRVKPSAVGAERACAHHVLRSLAGLRQAEASEEAARFRAFRVAEEATVREPAGAGVVRAGRAQVASTLTGEITEFRYAALRLTDGRLLAGLRRTGDGESSPAGDLGPEASELESALERDDEAEAVRCLERAFGPPTYRLSDLLADERWRIAQRTVRSAVEEAEAACERLGARYASVASELEELDPPGPAVLETVGEIVLAARGWRLLEAEVPDVERVEALLEEAAARGVGPRALGLERALAETCRRLARQVRDAPTSGERLAGLERAVRLAERAAEVADPREAQDAWWKLLGSDYSERKAWADGGDPEAAAWTHAFRELGERLGFAVEAITTPPSARRPAATPRSGSWR